MELFVAAADRSIALPHGLNLRRRNQCLEEMLMPLFSTATAELSLEGHPIAVIWQLLGMEVVNAGLLGDGIIVNQGQHRGNVIGFQFILKGGGVIAHKLILQHFQNGQCHKNQDHARQRHEMIAKTGGDAQAVVPLMPEGVRIVPDLVFRGLALACPMEREQ